MFTLYRVLSLVGTLIYVISVTYVAVAFLNISSNYSNDFKYSIPGVGRGDVVNGFLSTLVSSMYSFVAIYFEDKYGNCFFFEKLHCVTYTLYSRLGDIYGTTLVVFWRPPNGPPLSSLKIPSSSGSRVIMYNGISSWRCEQGEIVIKYYVYLCFL